jgi:ATP-dependent DNA helicase RecQ
VIKLREMMASSEGSEEFKRAEQQRLNAMLGLCEVTSCRRQVLLRYFGEELAQPCGNCDTCLEPVPTWDGTELARLALSAVYRTGQRFGVAHLIDVLRGGETEKILQFDHHRLSVYGMGKATDANRWRSVFRQLVARNFLSVDLDRFGALRLEEQCRALLRGEDTIAFRLDPVAKPAAKAARGSKATKAAVAGDIDITLYDALRECRRKLAEEQQVPPYVIFHNATLEDMCRLQPRSLVELGLVSGVGGRKLEKYGTAFLEVLQEHASAA